MNEIPQFKNEASCASAINPDLWFPNEQSGTRSVPWSHTPIAKLARSICTNCPAFDECKEYAIKFRDLSGIWAGQDRMERANEQRVRHLPVVSLYTTYPLLKDNRSSRERGRHARRR